MISSVNPSEISKTARFEPYTIKTFEKSRFTLSRGYKRFCYQILTKSFQLIKKTLKKVVLECDDPYLLLRLYLTQILTSTIFEL